MKHKRIIASILIATLSVTLLASIMISFTFGSEDHFYSSFEESETNTPLVNTADTNKGTSGLGLPLKAASANIADITGKVTATEATAGHNCTGDALKDSNSNTKYITKNKTAYVIYTLDQAYVLQEYTITTANDSEKYHRHPKDWTLYGSNDQTNWYPLDSRSGQTYVANYHVSTYTVKNSSAFQYYKLDITAIPDTTDGYTQFADWNLFGYAAPVGDFTCDVVAVEGTAAGNNKEVIGNLKDGDAATKYLVAGTTAEVIYTLAQAQPMKVYSMTSAGDAVQFSGRNPKDWTVSGSNDKQTWTQLDSQTGQNFDADSTVYTYTVSNTESYKYYKLSITANNNLPLTQLADWSLGNGTTPNPGLQTSLSSGPSGTWNSLDNKGWTGDRALAVRSSQISEDAHGYNVIYDGLEIPVTGNTQLSYMIFPDYVGSDVVEDYDMEYTSMHIAVDLKFQDGTYLSDLNAVDQNGDILSPKAQGESHALYTKQWNEIKSRIGEVAKGKVITQILVGFEKSGKEAAESLPIQAYIDDIKIEEKAEKVYKNQLSYTMTRRGSQSSSTFSRGLTFPAATYPNGFNYWSMCTTESGQQLYLYQPGNDITHFTVTHQASNWITQCGTFQFMPNTSFDIAAVTDAGSVSAANRKSDYDRDTMVDQANYIKVEFADETPAAGTTVELVPSDHAATVKFTFDKNTAYQNVIFDSVKANANSTAGTNCQFTFNEDGSFYGRTDETASAGMRYMYFYGTFSVQPTVTKELNAASADAMVTFPAGTTSVVMNLATSFISADQAKHNLELEIGDKTFKQVYGETEAAWLDIMDRIEIEGGTEEELINFWSSIYRAYMYPTNLSENQGTNEEPQWVYVSPYEGTNDSPVINDGRMYYNNGFWDTARTLPGLFSLLTPTAYSDYLNGFAEHYNASGWVGRWLAPGAYPSMVGTNSDAFFADAYLRGIDFDVETAYESALRNGSAYDAGNLYGRNSIYNNNHVGTEVSNYAGYVNNSLRQGLSWSLESYANDAAIAKLAEKLGDTDIATYYGNRALYYTKMFNEEVGFFMGKDANGNWSTDTDAYDPTIWNSDYTETNGWNYAFSVPYDGQGLANLYGGEEQLEAKLDEFFNTEGNITLGGERTTSSGVIHEMLEQREVKLGEYGHSNQPSHHIIFMYNYANAPEKAQYYARDILDRLYVGSSIGQGYVGDEDNGESSAWYIQAAMGIYPTNVGSGNYMLSSPLFDKVTLHLENGNDLEIIANNNSSENVYIQSVTIDGKAYDSTVISHEEFTNAKKIVFEMGSAPSDWGKTDGALDSLTTGDEVATPMEDLIPTTVAGSLPSASSAKDAVYSSDVALANLVDNTSLTSATVSGNTASVYVYYASGAVIEMYTVSNSTSTTNVPTAVALYGSDDGTDWKKLDESEVTFKWNQYVEPFAVENDTAYKYYRLDLSTTASSMQLSELELYGYAYKTATKESLLNVITQAKAIDQSAYAVELTALNTAITAAESVYNNESATAQEIRQAIAALQTEIAALQTTGATTRIEAEDCNSYSNLVLDSNASRSGGGNLGGVKPDSYAVYNYLDFGNGLSNITINYSRKDGADNGVVQSPDATIKVYVDSVADANLVGTISEPAYTATNWGTYADLTTALFKTVTGIHTVYLVFEGTGPCVVNLDYFTFS